MARSHGTLGSFNSASEDWDSYTERIGQYFLANDVKDADKKRAILLSTYGPSTYRTIKNVLAPQAPADVPYEDIVRAMSTHLQPKPSVIVERYKFHSRSRHPGESVADFVAELKRLSEHCEFGAALDEMIRDRIICGIVDERWQKRLLAEPKLSYEAAFQLALAMETAERQVKDMHSKSSENVAVHRVHQSSRAGISVPHKSPRDCYRCGKPHNVGDCPHLESVCHSCGKKGHLSRVCRSKPKNSRASNRKQQAKQPVPHKRTHQVTADKSTVAAHNPDADPNVYTMFHLPTPRSDPLAVKVSLNGVPVEMEVDTGATLSIISKATYHKLWPPPSTPSLQPTTARLKTYYTGEPITVEGSLDVRVAYQNQSLQSSVLVVDGDGPSLLGRDWLEHLILDWPKLHALHSLKPSCQDILDCHASVFEDKLGCLQDTSVKIHVDRQAQPKFFKARSVPYALRDKVEKELERLEKEDIIERVQFSEWATPIVPVAKKDGSVRICGDYKVTANQAALVDAYPLPRIEDLFASLSRRYHILEARLGPCLSTVSPRQRLQSTHHD